MSASLRVSKFVSLCSISNPRKHVTAVVSGCNFISSFSVTCDDTMLFLLSTILVTCVSSCSDTVASLVNNMPSCTTRPEVIKLEASLESRVRQLIPSHVIVSRCSGSCQHNIGHICTPSQYKKVNNNVFHFLPFTISSIKG